MSNETKKASPAGPKGGGPMGHISTEKAKNFKGTMLKLMSYLKVFRTSIIVVVIFAALSSVFTIIGPKLLGNVTTALFDGLIGFFNTGNMVIDFEYINYMCMILVGLYIVASAFSYVQGYIMSGISQKVTYNFRKDISEKINRMPLSYFDKRSTGEVMSRITNDVDTISNTLSQSMSQIISSIATVVGVVAMMLSINVWMTLAAMLIIPISGIMVMNMIKLSQKYFKTQQTFLGHINGHIEENYSGHKVVQAFGAEKRSAKEFKDLNDELYDSAWKSQFLSGMMMPIMNFVGNIGYVVICILGGVLATKGSISVGDIQAFIQYVRNFNQPIAQLASISNTLQSTAAAAERVFEFMDEDEEMLDTTTPVKPETCNGKVEFEKVHFGYEKGKTIINDFSAVIKPGQRIAIVGPTGAGKTTIVKLLMRFYELESGAIKIDGHNVNDYTREDLRSMFGMVLQDTWLYNASIMDNIRYGSFDKSDKEIIEAAKAAHCHDFIKALPGGYCMELNEDASNISQGQKQLLTIARTILSDPKILILDEATSSVDTRTEVLIQSAMDKLMHDRTSFVIAHRLSTIRNADTILVMKDGDIIEMGSHNELLAKQGFYANLYNSQFDGSIEE